VGDLGSNVITFICIILTKILAMRQMIFWLITNHWKFYPQCHELFAIYYLEKVEALFSIWILVKFWYSILTRKVIWFPVKQNFQWFVISQKIICLIASILVSIMQIKVITLEPTISTAAMSNCKIVDTCAKMLPLTHMYRNYNVITNTHTFV
jgi:putative component of membrane protein insertase Oxa1/YidC/SpoIIIJ protein YidD